MGYRGAYSGLSGYAFAVPRSWSGKLHEYVRLSQPANMTAMASPPTVTLGSGGAASSISSAVTVSVFNGTPGAGTVNTHGRFTMLGGPLTYRQVSGVSCVQTWASISGQTGVSSVSGWHYGTQMEWVLMGNGVGFYRLWVDDQPVTVNMQSGTGGTAARHHLLVNFGSSALRRVRIELDTQALESVKIGPTDTWQRDDAPSGPKVLLLGDSYSLGTGATVASAGHSYAHVLAQMMGWRDLLVAGSGGTGFTAAGSWGTYATRLSSSLGSISGAPDVVILQGSTNDNSATAGTVTTAATSLVAAVRAAYPSAYVVVLGLLYDTSRSAASLTNHNEVIAVSGADLVVNTVGGVEGAWWSGTGRVGATTGSGNGDVFMSSDAIHPTTEGHRYLASRLAARLRAAWTSLPIR